MSRAVVRRVEPGTKLQTLQLEVFNGEVLDVEHFEPFGLSGNPPLGAEAMVVFPGASRANGVAIAACDRRVRPVGLSEGETVLYNSNGDTIKLLMDGSIVIDSANGVVINGDLVVNGEIKDAVGDIATMRQQFNAHTHVDPQGGSVGSPTPQMS